MFYIGENVSLLQPLQHQGLLNEASQSQWNHKATFEWMELAGTKGTTLTPLVPPIPSPTALQQREACPQANFAGDEIYHVSYDHPIGGTCPAIGSCPIYGMSTDDVDQPDSYVCIDSGTPDFDELFPSQKAPILPDDTDLIENNSECPILVNHVSTLDAEMKDYGDSQVSQAEELIPSYGTLSTVHEQEEEIFPPQYIVDLCPTCGWKPAQDGGCCLCPDKTRHYQDQDRVSRGRKNYAELTPESKSYRARSSNRLEGFATKSFHHSTDWRILDPKKPIDDTIKPETHRALSSKESKDIAAILSNRITDWRTLDSKKWVANSSYLDSD